MAKFMTADEAVKLIKSGDHVFIQGSTSIPEVLSESMARRYSELRNVTVYNAFAVAKGPAPYTKPEMADSFFVDSVFVSNSETAAAYPASWAKFPLCSATALAPSTWL